MGASIETTGIPVVQITALPEVAKMVGANRILRGTAIPYVAGDKNLPADQEKELNFRFFEKALEILQTPVEEQTVFTLN